MSSEYGPISSSGSNGIGLSVSEGQVLSASGLAYGEAHQLPDEMGGGSFARRYPAEMGVVCTRSASSSRGTAMGLRCAPGPRLGSPISLDPTICSALGGG